MNAEEITLKLQEASMNITDPTGVELVVVELDDAIKILSQLSRPVPSEEEILTEIEKSLKVIEALYPPDEKKGELPSEENYINFAKVLWTACLLTCEYDQIEAIVKNALLHLQEPEAPVKEKENGTPFDEPGCFNPETTGVLSKKDKSEAEKKLEELFNLEQQLGINEHLRFHNSEEGAKQYEALFHSDKKESK